MTIALLYPIPRQFVAIVTQTFAQHVARGLPNYFGGVDWAVPTGTPVACAADGVVTRCGEDGTGYGTHVRIQHAGGYLTIYAHLRNYAAQVGQPVKAGDVIGYSDNTGNSTGPHLHFEMRKDGKAIDPAPLFMAVEVPEQPAGAKRVQAGWNLRATPGGQIIAMTWNAGDVEIVERDGDWAALELWVHQDALSG